MKYFTKSSFRLALECETRLYYASKRDEYANASLDDSFLQSLADGGFQVGALAQFLLVEDPVAAGLVAKEVDAAKALKETEARLGAEDATMAEASFAYDQYFIRADLVKKSHSQLEVYEVKAKSFGGSRDEFWTREKKGIASAWKPYLYDIAFQTWVIRHAHPEWEIRPYLVLADKTRVTSIDGLNQCFKISGTSAAERISIRPGLTRSDLGNMVITPLDVTEEVEFLLAMPIESEAFGVLGFEEYVRRLAHGYTHGEKLKSPAGKKCKDCPFRADPGSTEAASGLKSGFHECWNEQHGILPEAFGAQSILDLWNFRKADEMIAQGIYFLSDLAKEPEWQLPVYPEESGMTSGQRQVLQVQMASKPVSAAFLLTSGLKKEMARWNYPLHFIDFETSAPALPFTHGHRPYELIAFQFSMHDVDAQGQIRHAAQYLNDTIGAHPNYEFVRALKAALEQDHGTVFRYADHENTVLNRIRMDLLEDPDVPRDKDELVRFTESLIHYKDEHGKKVQGERCMVDMLDLVTRFYYHPSMKGSNSIKKVLPAAIASSELLRTKYSLPIYGTDAIPSLNVQNHVWIDEKKDPYKTLPPLFSDLSEEELETLSPELEAFEAIREGGAAMTAYCKLQFTEVAENQRNALISGLLRYCELDTMAMVMLYEYWKDEISTR